MKTALYLLLSLLPAICNAQQQFVKALPGSYMWRYVGDSNFAKGGAEDAHLVFSPAGVAHLALLDGDLNDHATVLKFDGAAWVSVGNKGFTDNFVASLGFDISPAGEPTVAFTDMDYSLKATAMKFDGTNWVFVGNPGFSFGISDEIALAYDPGGVLYIAFRDYATGHGSTVMKYDEGNWALVGSRGFTNGRAEYICLDISPSGEPYLAYEDVTNSQKSSVMKFDGTSWVYVGNAGFSEGAASNISFAFGPSGIPYIAYHDDVNFSKVTVKNYDGSGWVTVGQPGFSSMDAYGISLAISPSGEPYVAYATSQYAASNGKASVMKFDGSSWVYVGSPAFTSHGIYNSSLVFSSSGVPYLEYTDYSVTSQLSVMKYDNNNTGTDESALPGFSFYPNPAVDKITFVKVNGDKPFNVTIMTIDGQTAITEQVSLDKPFIDIDILPPGLYFVRYQGEHTLETGRFVKL